jgi:hypothetical protein
MSKYGYSVYGYSKYGITPKLAYSVEPMDVNVIKFHEVYVSWQLPTGDFTRFRVVRNQNAYPETAEDGIIIYELLSTDGESLEGNSTLRYDFYDGSDNPAQPGIAPGRNIFYRVFLYTTDDVWVKAGQISEVVPEDTGAITKMMDLLPRVLTSSVLSPLGVIQEDSELYQFLDGLAFSYEQMMTEIKLARPAHNLENSNYKTIPGEVLNLGLNSEANMPMIRQRALIREAIGLYSNKGTALGVANYSEALTGFAPTVTTSSNLMLSIQDSTFYESTGRWVSANATISSSDEMVPNNVDNSIDLVYTLKVIAATTSASISLGLDDPITQGIPIQPSTEYAYKANIKCPTSGGATLKIEYYDKNGTVISNITQAISATNSWQTISKTATSPSDASYVVLYVLFSTATTYYVDMIYVGATPFVEYDEARATTIQLAPTYENYVENPSFEVDDSNWTLTGLTFTQDADVPLVGYPGSSSGKFVAAGAWTLECDSVFPVETGIYFNVSHYMKSPDMTTMDVTIELYDVDDNLVDTEVSSHEITDVWERAYTSILIPPDSTAVYAKARHEGTAGTFYLDMVMAQDTYAPSDYFDGSMPELVGAIWEGTANASTSLYYPNKSTKILRLAQTLNDWMPMNSWWRITTPAELEYTNLDV